MTTHRPDLPHSGLDSRKNRKPDDQIVSRRLARLLKLIGMLQAGGRTVDQLREILGVSRRTMFRDVQVLRKGGLPVRLDRKDRCLSLHPSERVLPRTLTEQELHALALATKTSIFDASAELAPLIDSALSKLLGAARGDYGYEIYQSARHCRLDLPQEMTFGGPGVLHEMLEGLRTRMCVDVTLREPLIPGRQTAQFCPCGIQATGAGISFVGQYMGDSASITLQLASIEHAQRTQQAFVIPDKFFSKRAQRSNHRSEKPA